MDSLFAVFDKIVDPRMNRRKKYPLGEIMFLTLCAVISGVQSWRGIEDFGQDRLDWLQKYMKFQEGIPSHQTIGRVFSLLSPKSLVKSYAQFLAQLFNCTEDEVIAIDGKALRHSFDKASGQKALHILNAWAVNAGLSLAQVRVDEKTNEITALPEILDLIDIKGAIVTTDALNTQKSTCEKIIEKGGDYVLPVKGNHKNLMESIEEMFDTQPLASSQYVEETEKNGGRIEVRKASILSAFGLLEAPSWSGLTHIGRMEREVERGDKTTHEIQYYILSFGDINRFFNASRGHWGVENSLHWVLDVTFDEDACRVRKDHAPENFSQIRKMALNILKADKQSKLSIPRKQARAARNTDYLDELLSKVKKI